jgi:hypothetical protein
MSFITSPGVIVPPLTAGGVAYGTGSQAKVNNAGTAGQVLQSAGAGVPVWATPSSGPGTNQVLLRTGNGTGSTGDKIRRFTTTVINTGTAITYADSATDGASFTINEDGIYAVVYADTGSVGAYYGITVNQPDLTINVFSVPNANTIGFILISSTAASSTSFSTVFRFVASDVVRPCIGNTVAGTTSQIRFYITKIAS